MRWNLRTLAFCLLFFSFSALGQFAKSFQNSAFNEDVQKVVAEYSRNFENAKGDVIDQGPQSTEYTSLIKVTDVKHCSVMEYSSAGRPVCSWHGVVMITEDYAAASRKYKWLYSQLKDMTMFDVYKLDGKYQAPDESRKFTSTLFSVTDAPEPLQKMVVEASMQYEFPEWKVRLLVYEKENDDSDEEAEAVAEDE